MNHIFPTSVLFKRNSEMYRTRLIVQTYEKGQTQSDSHSCTELSKTQFFPVSIVNTGKRRLRGFILKPKETA